MTITIRNKAFAVVALMALAIVSVFAVAKANPFQFGSTAQTSAATSSPAYMSPGAATSTIVYDTFEVNGTNQTNRGNTFVADSATLLAQYTASSTATSQININFEYADGGSVNCVTNQNNCDWYQAGPQMIAGGYATTTLPISLNQVTNFIWKAASSTPGLAALASTTQVDTRAIQVKTPLRYIRAIASVPAGAGNGAIWMQFVPLKQAK